MKASLQFVAGLGGCWLMALGSSLRADDAQDSPMYGIGEPQSAVPAKFRQSTAAADEEMTQKVAAALKEAFPNANLYVTTTADHMVYLRGFTQGEAETTQIVATTTKLVGSYKVKNDLRVDMFARPGPLNGPQDK